MRQTTLEFAEESALNGVTMKIRILLGLTMLAAVLGVLWVDHYLESHGRPFSLPLTALLIVAAYKGFRELAQMAAATRVKLLPVSGIVSTIALAAIPFWWRLISPGEPTGRIVLMALGLILLAIFGEQMIRSRTNNALQCVACTVLALTYVGAGLAMILAMRTVYGVPVLLVFLAGVKCTDIGAYFVGSAIGRHKLIPWLSPGKSWEGLIGGLIAGAVAAACVHWALDVHIMTSWQAALFGIAMGLAGQLGDLCESLLKRSVQVKDSGNVLPEYGGILDILDSPLLAAPVAMLLLMVITGS